LKVLMLWCLGRSIKQRLLSALSAFLLHKIRDTRNRRFQNSSIWIIGILIKEEQKLWQRREREKDFRVNDRRKKGGAFFQQGVLQKMYGCETAEKKKIKKG
jgi:hypothetical protein